MRETRELPIPRRLYTGDCKAVRRPCKVAVAQHGTLSLRTRVAAVKIELNAFIARTDRLRNLLPVGIEKGTDAKFCRLHNGFREIEETDRRLLALTATIKAENPLLLLRCHYALPNSFERSAAVKTASMSADRTPARSSTRSPAAVVPAGLVTAALRSAGECADASAICAAPSMVCAASSDAVSRFSPAATPPSISASIMRNA